MSFVALSLPLLMEFLLLGKICTMVGLAKILELIKENPNITRQKMASIIGLSIEGIDKNIRKLKAENKVIRIGSDKGGHWEIVK